MARKKTAQSLPLEERMRCVLAVENGSTQREVVEHMRQRGWSLSQRMVGRLVEQYIKTGSLAMRKASGRPVIQYTPQLVRHISRLARANRISRRLSRAQLAEVAGHQ